MKKILYNFAAYIALTMFLASCITRNERHGYMFELSDYEILQEGVTSKDRVLGAMGSPTIISDLGGDETWIYYSEDVKSLLFFLPKITSRTLVSLRFDENGTIRELEKFDLESEDKGLEFISNYTKVESNKTGFFKSIFGNIGKISPQ